MTDSKKQSAAAAPGGFPGGRKSGNPGRPSESKAEAKRRVAAARTTTADTASRRATAAGATGVGLSGAQRVLRDSAVIAYIEAGKSVSEAGKAFGVSARTARAIFQRSRQTPSPLDARPMAMIENQLRRCERQHADYMAMAYRYAESAPSAAIGALKGASEQRRILHEMLKELGFLPRDMTYFKTMAEIQHFVGEIVDRLAAFDRGELSSSDVRGYAEAVLLGERPLWENGEGY